MKEVSFKLLSAAGERIISADKWHMAAGIQLLKYDHGSITRNLTHARLQLKKDLRTYFHPYYLMIGAGELS